MVHDILAFIVFFAALKCKVDYDYKRWRKGLGINHGLELAITAIPMAYVIYAASRHANIFISIILVDGCFMLLFNGWFNKKRKFGWWFIGGKDANDSVTERVFRFVGPLFTVVIQLAFVIVPAILYILNLKKMKKLFSLLLLAVVAFSSCTGGNESVTGVTGMDYLPSIMMLAGSALAAYGVFKYKKAFNDVPNALLIVIGGLVAIFGFIIYVS